MGGGTGAIDGTLDGGPCPGGIGGGTGATIATGATGATGALILGCSTGIGLLGTLLPVRREPPRPREEISGDWRKVRERNTHVKEVHQPLLTRKQTAVE